MNDNSDHVDFLNQPLEIGDYVIAAVGPSLNMSIDLYKIDSFDYTYHRNSVDDVNNCKRRLRIVHVNLYRQGMKRKKLSSRRANCLIRIDPKLLTMKALKA